MIYLNLILNIVLTIISALGSFMQYHYLTENFPSLIREITNSNSMAALFGVLSLSLPLIISHLVSSNTHIENSHSQALSIIELYKKIIYLVFTILAFTSLVLFMLGFDVLSKLFFLLSTSILAKNLLYGYLGFLNGYGRILEENIIKLIAGICLILSTVILTKFYYWLPSLIQIITLLLLCQISMKKLGQSWAIQNTQYNKISTLNLRSIRNHILISLPGYFIFNLNILISGVTIPPEHLKSLVKHFFFLQGIITVLASSVRILARNFNIFYLKNNRILLQKTVTFYAKVCLIFLPVCLGYIYLYTPSQLQSYFNLGESMPKQIIFLFLLFICIEGYQVSLTSLSYSTGKSDYFVVTWVSAIAGCILTAVLTPTFGVTGSIISLFVSQQCTCNYFNYLKFKKYFNLNIFLDYSIWRDVFYLLPLGFFFLFKNNDFTKFGLFITATLITLVLLTRKELKAIQTSL